MSVAISWVAALWTAAGAVLLFQEAGSQAWWDAVWVLLLALSAYIVLVQVGGLSRARMCAGGVLVVFAGMIVLTALSGWPLGPVRFTGPSALRIANMFPLLPPLLAFSLLTICQRAMAVAFPGLGMNGLAAFVSGIFAATILNGAVFLSEARLWWLWNPWGEGFAVLPALIGVASIALAGFFLARIYPEDTDLKLTRWSSAASVLIVVNTLFLAANALNFMGHL
jgi:hypothetical protein